MSYFPLWCKSYFSFLEGASAPDELLQSAQELGLPGMALCDRDGLYGIVRAHIAAKNCNLKLLIGSEISVEQKQKLLLIARSKEGYSNLCKLITQGRRRNIKGHSHVYLKEVLQHSPGLSAICIPDFIFCQSKKLLNIESQLQSIKDHFGEHFVFLAPRHGEPSESCQEELITKLASQLKCNIVAGNEVLYHNIVRRKLQDILTCIRYNKPLTQIGTRIKPNAEHYLKSSFNLRHSYIDHPEWMYNSLAFSESCSFSLDELRYYYPAEELPNGMSSADYLTRLVHSGSQKRFGETPSVRVEQQIQKELSLIKKLDYCGYFLTMYEIVQFCKANNILCQGRGSAANSIVCYCLGITAIDPVRLDLLFERFISQERKEPPDIDLDIEHERREEVIQHVYKKYGRDHAAMVANVIRYRSKSAVRDVGKALGVSSLILERLSKLLSHHQSITPQVLRQIGIEYEGHPTFQTLLELSSEIIDFPRHLSIHPGGFLLGHAPVNTIVPIENATMAKRTVIQWDKHDIEDLGLFKVDLLGLGALSQIHRAFDLIRESRGLDINLSTIPARDLDTFEMISQGDTIGVFQIESRAQMSMLPRLKPKTFYDLVIEVSIVRPGPITGGMVHPYLRRRNGEEEITYPHPSLEPVLKKTLGIPLFQEQVMKLAIVAADYTPGEADQLRRAMAAWQRSGHMETHRAKLVARMTRKGIKPEFAERVFEQIKGFGEYGFPESHAASFALIAYATAFLKRHFAPEFVCSLLNAQPMGFYSVSTIIHDAKRHGIEVLPISIKHSEWDCTIEAKGKRRCLRMGLRYVKGLSISDWKSIHHIVSSCTQLKAEALIREVTINTGVLSRLAESGAFDDLNLSRREALWMIPALVKARRDRMCLSDSRTKTTFSPLSHDQEIIWDYSSSTHSTRGHILSRFRHLIGANKIPCATVLNTLKDGTQSSFVGVVICRQRPGTASGVTFFTLEDESGLVNVIVWPSVFEKYELVAKTATILQVYGRVQSEHGIVHLIAERLSEPGFTVREVPASRDFH